MEYKEKIRRVIAYNSKLQIGKEFVRKQIDKDFVFSEPAMEQVEDIFIAITKFSCFLADNNCKSVGQKKKLLMDLNTLLLPMLLCDKTKTKHLKKFFKSFAKYASSRRLKLDNERVA